MKVSSRELFELCQRTQSLAVMDVDGLACDNAAATLGASFTRGDFTAEFVDIWFNSVLDILENCEFVTESARVFFANNGLES